MGIGILSVFFSIFYFDVLWLIDFIEKEFSEIVEKIEKTLENGDSVLGKL